MAGYVRQEAANIVNGNTIQASHFNNEYNQLQAAFNVVSGHSHDGSTAGEGPKISLTTAVSGVLPAANGGLGAAVTSAGGLIVLSGVTITAAIWNGGAISGATLSAVVITGSTFNGGNISGGTISGAIINGGNISATTLSAVTINGSTISGSTISATDINGGILSGVSIRSPSGVDIIGKKTIWVPALAMNVLNTSGCAPHNTITTHASAPDITVLAFDAAANEGAQFVVAFPKSWDAGTVTAKFYWLYLSGSNNGAVWRVQATSHGDGETISGTTWGTPVDVTGSAGTVATLDITAETGPITIAGTPDVEGLNYFKVERVATNGGDSLTGDADLIGVKLYFTTISGNDV